jgi:hypothetical protein
MYKRLIASGPQDGKSSTQYRSLFAFIVNRFEVESATTGAFDLEGSGDFV